MRWVLNAVSSSALLIALATPATAAFYEQGFETNTNGWLDSDDFAGYGDVSRVASGTNGITSASGSSHAIFTQTNSGPFTRFDMYRSIFPGEYTARADIYLDTNMLAGEGFDYSVASSSSSGDHLRDFIFHVAKDTSTGTLLVGGSNNTNSNPREDLETINHFEVASSGWYTFEHLFRNNGGVLAVDLNLYDSNNQLLFTETRSNPVDLIPSSVGGNRYGWFTNIDVTGGIAVDNVSLQLAAVPEPSSIVLFGLGLGFIAVTYHKRRRKPMSVQNT